MQPCAVCGGVLVDAAGYCTQCRTFRGVPQQQPYTPYPTSVPPGYPQQTSGGGYPGSYPPPRGRSFLVPLIALGATLFVLVVAIVVVAATGGGGDDPDPIANPTTATASPSGQSSASPSATPAGAIDQCVIGTWRVTSHREDVNVPNRGKVSFTGGEEAMLRLNADGTGETDYRGGTKFEGDMDGQKVTLEISGTVTYRYTAADGKVSLSDLESNATGKLFLDGEQYGDPLPFEGSEEPVTYTCSGDDLTQRTFLFTTEYTRVS
ncbi:hypothetical protein [Phytohabitans aurantiacus]|uniref:Lipocalin-like domain-containing protein n=1 Tax=Phytohabitans aurantiacus TaxID=3016789 RepID=A0ABQ5QN29_9ACTN|nr:hypothetical protein [Phytohabitans aurantiacus]GLH95232.1 hypothetical protein Pa4123_05040 [Phytohabitans aurantiacus]